MTFFRQRFVLTKKMKLYNLYIFLVLLHKDTIDNILVIFYTSKIRNRRHEVIASLKVLSSSEETHKACYPFFLSCGILLFLFCIEMYGSYSVSFCLSETKEKQVHVNNVLAPYSRFRGYVNVTHKVVVLYSCK